MMNIDPPLFSSLPEAALERIRCVVQTRHYAAGEIILNEGEMREELFVIVTGNALVVGRDWHGQARTLARLGPGECFGELSMLSGEPASATVEAASDTELWVLSHADFVAVADDYPKLSQNLSALLAERLRASNERYLNAQRAQLITLLAPGAPAWAFWLSYHLTLSVAKHTRQPVALLDLSGRAKDSVATAPAMHSLASAVEGALTWGVADDSLGSGADLQVVAFESADAARMEAPVTAALDQLRDQARYVFAYVGPEDLAAQPALHQADATLVLVDDSSAGNATPALAASPEQDDRQTSIVLISEGRSASTVGDVRKARASLGSQWRAVHVIPGGVQAIDREPLEAPWSSHAVDRLARAVAGLTVGLALGGGGAKGYAHIGVVKGLQRAGVPFDYIVGCSIGASLAAGVAAGWSPDEIKNNLDTISRKAVRPTLPFLSILTSRSIRSELRNLAGDQCFDDLPTPLGIVAVDIVTGEEVLLRSGLVWQAMLASMAYPGIYEPVHLDDRYLVDGAVLNPVPVSAAVTLGADVIISSGFGPSSEDRDAQPQAIQKGRRPLILGTIARSLEIMQSKIGRESSARADVAIQSVFEETPGLLDFKRGRELADVGLQAVEQALPKLRTVLPWLA